MQRVIVLGSSAALSSASRDNTFFAFDSPRGVLLIDCAGSPYQKLLRAGLDPIRLEGIIATHHHPDHIYGIPSLVHHFIMRRRETPLSIYANSATLRAIRGTLGILGLKPDFISLNKIPDEECFALIDNDEYTLFTSPVRHVVPTVAIKIISKFSGASVVFSADTSPCQELIALAMGADILFHECSSFRPTRGHSSPLQAGNLAMWCDVKRLILVHLGSSPAADLKRTLNDVRGYYKGEVEIAEDFGVYELIR
jgi:ribonuclease Z